MLTTELSNATIPTGFGPVHRIEVQAVAHGGRGPVYSVWMGGSLIIERAREPLLEACRMLQRRGLRGRVEMRGRGEGKLRMTADIERGALLTVTEGDRQNVSFTEWKDLAEVHAEDRA